MKKLTIITTTYNRRDRLPFLYESLKNQTCKDFQWLIIDDGSTDDTANYISELSRDEIYIEYYKKENGGKHTALNYAHKYVEGNYVCIVDSDDVLTQDAVKTILLDWNNYEHELDVGVISYLKGKDFKKAVTKIKCNDYYLDNHFSYRINHGILGDQFEVLRRSLFIKYPFPVLKNEKFFPEGWLWNKLAHNYKTLYRNEIIYVCQYLEGGLTRSGRKLRMMNPYGMMEDCKTLFTGKVKTKIKAKAMFLYGIYGFCSQLSMQEFIKSSGKKWVIVAILPFSFTLYKYWKYKYFTRR